MSSEKLTTLAIVAAIAALVSLGVVPAWAATLVVDDDGIFDATTNTCAGTDTAFTTISAAVAAASAGDTILVCFGTYPETVVLTRDDLTLQGETATGSEIAGAIVINGARRVVIDTLTVRNPVGSGVVGFQGAAFTVQNSTINDNGRNGFFVLEGSSAVIDNNKIQGNGVHGVFIDGSSAIVTNNSIISNALVGVRVTNSGNALIGLTRSRQAGGNDILSNRDGISLSTGGTAFIYGNTIDGNTGAGVSIFHAAGHLVGENTITNNGLDGVQVFGGSLIQGRGDFPITPNHATINNNGRDGIFAFRNATLDIRDATISGNTRFGIFLILHSTLGIVGADTIISGHGSGILVNRDSAVHFNEPAASVTGNSFGVFCTDLESSIGEFPAGPIATGVTGNTQGDVSCTDYDDKKIKIK